MRLNSSTIERLRFRQQMRAHAEMLQFSIGGRGSFHAEGDAVVEGILTRYNRKTMTIIADGGRYWNVSTSLLRRAGAFETEETDRRMSFGWIDSILGAASRTAEACPLVAASHAQSNTASRQAIVVLQPSPSV